MKPCCKINEGKSAIEIIICESTHLVEFSNICAIPVCTFILNIVIYVCGQAKLGCFI